MSTCPLPDPELSRGRKGAVALLTLVLATAGLAQQRLDLYVPNPNPVAGESMQLRAISRNPAGTASEVTAGATWNSNNSNVLRVEPNGMATAVQIGRATLNARMGNLQSGGVTVTVLPSRIEIEPAFSELNVGGQAQLRATAFNVHGEPLPYQFNQWEITGANGGQINAAGITQTGLLEARASGRVTVRAVVSYGGDPSVSRVWGTATVVIRPPRDYRLRRVLSSDMVGHSFQVRPWAVGNMRANDAGQVVVPACLDGLVCGLLLLDQGRVDLLVPGGRTAVGGFFGNAWALTDTPGQAAINSSGQVLAHQLSHPGGESLLVADRQRSAPLVFGRQNIGGLLNIGGFRIGKDSYNDNGEAVFTAFAGASGQALLRYVNRNFDVVALSTTALGGIAAPLGFPDYGIDNNATAYFLVQGAVTGNTFGSPPTSLYRKEGFGAPVRVLGPGDTLAGGTVRSVWSMAVDRAGGGVAFCLDLEDGRQLLVRDSRGVRSTIATQGVGQVYSAGPSGVLVLANGARGNGLYVWRGTALVPLLMLGTLLDSGEPVRQIDSAYLTSSGRLFAQVATPLNPLVVVGPDNRTLLAGGSRVDLTAGFQFSALGGRQSMLMASPGPGRLLLRFGGASVFEFDGEGLTPRLLAGDIVGERTVVGGQSLATRGGDIYFVPSDGGLYRLRGGTVELVFASGQTLVEGVTARSFQVLDANDSGAVVLTANEAGQNWLLVAEGGRLRTLARSRTPSPTGGTLTNWNEVVIDDTGRVMAAIQTDKPGQQQGELVLYADGTAEPVLVSGQTQITGMVAGGASNLRARGNRFYLRVQGFACCDSQMVEYSGGQWNLLAGPGDRMPDGPQMRGIGMFDVNGRGEAMVSAQAQFGFFTLMHLGAEGNRYVQSDYLPTDEGDVIAQMNSVLYNDDGSAWLSAFDARGRFVIYAVEPVRR